MGHMGDRRFTEKEGTWASDAKGPGPWTRTRGSRA